MIFGNFQSNLLKSSKYLNNTHKVNRLKKSHYLDNVIENRRVSIIQAM